MEHPKDFEELGVRRKIGMFEQGGSDIQSEHQYEVEETKEEYLENVYKRKRYVRNELRIVLIGKTGSGKSATANTILGRRHFDSRAAGSSVTSKCQSATMKYGERSVLLVDTPGMFDTRMTNDMISKEVMKCVAITSPGIHAVILVTTTGRFTEEEQKTVQLFKDEFGDEVMDYMMVVFTGKEKLEYDGSDVQQFVKDGPPLLQKLVSECGDRIFAVNNTAQNGEKDGFRDELISAVNEMVDGNGGRCYTTEMYQKAEAMMKKRVTELIKNIEEKTRAEREGIEKELDQMKKKVPAKDYECSQNMKELKEQHDNMYEEMKAKFKQLKAGKERELNEKQEGLRKVKANYEDELKKLRERTEQLEIYEKRCEALEEIERRQNRHDETIERLEWDVQQMMTANEKEIEQARQQLEKLSAEGQGGAGRDMEDEGSRQEELNELLIVHRLETEKKARAEARKEVEEERGFFAFFQRGWKKFKAFFTEKK